MAVQQKRYKEIAQVQSPQKLRKKMVKQIFFSNVWYVKKKHKREKGENFVPKFGLNSFVHIKRVIMKIIYCVAM